MNLNIIPTPKIAMLCAAFCAALFAFNQNAHALTIGDNHQLGVINHGNVGDPFRPALLNHLIGMALGGSDTFNGESFTRSMNNFGSLPTVLAIGSNGTGRALLSAAAIYLLLSAYYVGHSGAPLSLCVGDLNGTITIPALKAGAGLSGWTLFGPGGQGVPDGGTTVVLLGAALSALGMARRYIKS